MDANYKFIYVGVVWGIFHNSVIGKIIITNLLNIPGPYFLANGETKVPYVIVAADGFPLIENHMKPQPFRWLLREQIGFLMITSAEQWPSPKMYLGY